MNRTIPNVCQIITVFAADSLFHENSKLNLPTGFLSAKLSNLDLETLMMIGRKQPYKALWWAWGLMTLCSGQKIK